jgi:hypothetical protein
MAATAAIRQGGRKREFKRTHPSMHFGSAFSTTRDQYSLFNFEHTGIVKAPATSTLPKVPRLKSPEEHGSMSFMS